MLFDIHCHILPAIDDGSKSIKETEKMFRMARKERIGTILATPHYSCEREPEFDKRCQNVYEEVCQMIQERIWEYSFIWEMRFFTVQEF